MRELRGQLACVFLDADDLCSLHKRHGHAFLPRACQAFPFGVAQDERGDQVALLSRYCPSIAQNYGEPILSSLPAKLAQLDPPPAMSRRMGLRSGRTLPLDQYAQLVEAWRRELDTTGNVGSSLVRLYALTEAVDAALPRDHAPNDAGFRAVLDQAWKATPAHPVPRRALKWGGRILLSLLLGTVSEPLHLLQPFRVERVSLGEHLRAWWVRMKWFLGRGRVRLLFIDTPIQLRALPGVAPCLRGEPGRSIAQYLREVLARRQGMHKQTYLHRFVIELGLLAVVAACYARARAQSRREHAVSPSDIQEGIGVAELLLTHQGEMGHNPVLDQLRLQLLSNPDDFQALLGAES